MSVKLYAYKDVLIGVLGMPFACHNDAEAARRAKFELSKVEDVNIQHDMQLFCLGSYDTQTGVIDPDFYYVEIGEINEK